MIGLHFPIRCYSPDFLDAAEIQPTVGIGWVTVFFSTLSWLVSSSPASSGDLAP